MRIITQAEGIDQNLAGICRLALSVVIGPGNTYFQSDALNLISGVINTSDAQHVELGLLVFTHPPTSRGT